MRYLILLVGIGLLSAQFTPVRVIRRSASTPVPTMIQWSSGSSSNTSGGASGGGAVTSYDFYLPNGTQSGNAIVGCVTGGSTTATMTVTDDQSNTYSVQATGTDSTNTARIFAFRALNVTANTRKLTFTPSSSIDRVAPVVAEFNNIATSSADDGNATGNSASGSSTVSTGSITPGTAGDLLFQCGYRSQTPYVGSNPGYTKGTGWTLLATDTIDGLAAQYIVHTSGSITPSFTMGSNSGYVTAAIALKAASAGAARPAGKYIIGIQHISINQGRTATSPLLLQFPSAGNMLAAVIGPGGNTYNNTALTDSASNTWAQAYTMVGDSNNGKTQMYYACNATTSNALTLSSTTTAEAGFDQTILLYDVAGMATNCYVRGTTAYDNSGSVACCTPTVFTSQAVPATDGLALFQMSVAFDTCSSIGAPSGAKIATSFAHGLSLSGPEPVDQNNCWAHYPFSSSARQTWTPGFTQDGSHAISGYAAGFGVFLSATGTALPNIIQQATSQNAASATTLATTVAATKSGSALIIGIGNGNSRTVTKVCTDGTTCAAGNSFSQATSAAASSGTLRTDIWYLMNAPAGTTTVTITYSASATNREAIVYELYGITATDGANNKSGTVSSSTVTGAAVTTTAANGFVLGVTSVSNSVTVNPKAGNEFVDGGVIWSNTTDAAASLISTSAATHTPTWTDASGTYCASTAAFK